LKHELAERLRYRQAWLRDFLVYKQHKEITNKVSNQIYTNIPILSFLLKIYFLPTLLLKFIRNISEWHTYNRCLKEIQILKEEIKKNENN